EGAQAPGPCGSLQAFEADAVEDRCPGLVLPGHGVAGSLRGPPVLEFVALVAEAVLEVQAQVLDRCAPQLRRHRLGEELGLSRDLVQARDLTAGLRTGFLPGRGEHP